MRPPHTFDSVVQELAQGLSQGSVALDREGGKKIIEEALRRLEEDIHALRLKVRALKKDDKSLDRDLIELIRLAANLAGRV
jgi:hypothetical protein